jgi:tRNA G46 methylase TrmB
MPFFGCLLDKLALGGTITLVTNKEAYFSEAKERSLRVWQLRILSERVLGREDLPSARTHFEKKYLERGEACFEFVVGK